MREFTGKVLRPKIATQSLREPAQSKCTGTCDKSRFMRHLMRIYKKNAGAQDWDAQFVRARAVEMHMDMQEPFYGRIRRKNAGNRWTPLI